MAEARRLQALHPGQILILRYEDFVVHPLNTTKRLFKEFLGWNMTDLTEEFLQNAISNEVTDIEFNGESSSTLFRGSNDHWRQDISWRHLMSYQRHCTEIMESLGYKPMTSSRALQNLRLKSFDHNLDKIQQTVEEDDAEDEDGAGQDSDLPEEPINPGNQDGGHGSKVGEGNDAGVKQDELALFKQKLEKIEGFLQNLKDEKNAESVHNESPGQLDSPSQIKSQPDNDVPGQKESQAKNDVPSQNKSIDEDAKSKAAKETERNAFKIKLQRLQAALNAMRDANENDQEEEPQKTLEREAGK